jgi:hypothetical protein
MAWSGQDLYLGPGDMKKPIPEPWRPKAKV